jgi:hypothetical protein
MKMQNVDPEIILAEAASIAGQLFLGGWTLELDDSLECFGMCDLKTKTIRLSPSSMVSWEDARLTVRHELAHALMNEQHGVAHSCVMDYIKNTFQNAS